MRDQRAAHPPARLRDRLRARRRGRLPGRGDGGHPARDGPGLHASSRSWSSCWAAPATTRARSLGGLLLGLVEQLASLFLTTQVNEAVAYVLLVLVLLVRPTGLLGGPRRVTRWLPGLASAVLCVGLGRCIPLVATGYGVRVMLQLFMWIALAQSWNLISGLTGYVSFGHVAFFGMGAYTTAHPHRQAGRGRGRVAAPGRRRDRRRCSPSSSAGRACGSRGPTSPSPCSGSTRCCAWLVSYFEGLTGGGLRALAAHAGRERARSTTRWAWWRSPSPR